jgi:trehalose-phosphatase
LTLLFDYDGTLTPIAQYPRLAVLDRGTRGLLARLARRPRVNLGVLSGRQLDDLKTLVPLPELWLAGTGGMELDLRGRRVEHPQAERAAVLANQFAMRVEETVRAYAGVWVERKRLALTIHYRHLLEHLVAQLRTHVEQASRDFAGQFRIVHGPKAWEIAPAWGWTKGTGVRLILGHLGASTKNVLYAGDGANDAEAIDEVASLGGITFGIGPHAPSAAQYHLPDHAALRGFLHSLDASLGTKHVRPVVCARGQFVSYGPWKPIS